MCAREKPRLLGRQGLRDLSLDFSLRHARLSFQGNILQTGEEIASDDDDHTPEQLDRCHSLPQQEKRQDRGKHGIEVQKHPSSRRSHLLHADIPHHHANDSRQNSYVEQRQPEGPGRILNGEGR